MDDLNFLHFPKIDVIGQDLEIKSVCLAGASEINPEVLYNDELTKKGEGQREPNRDELISTSVKLPEGKASCINRTLSKSFISTA